jgi:ABC-type multidrug transport system fused ATPase/permease subunit
VRNSSEPRGGAVFHLYRDLWQLLRGRQRVFAGAVILLIGAQVILLSIPYLSGRALNALQLHGTAGLAEAAGWLASALLVACASWLLHGPARFLERNAALTIRQRMSSKLLAKLFALPLSWHESHHSGATAHRVQQSTLALSGFAQSQFIYLNSTVRLLGPLAALFWVQPLVGTAAVVGFALIILSVAGFDRAMLRLASEENAAERRYAAALIDSLGNTGTVYALRQARLVAARVESKLLAVFVPLRKSIVLNEAKWCTVDLATRTLNCCLIGLFVWLATRTGTSAGTGTTLLLGSLYMVWEYAQQAAGVIASIASHFQTFARQHADYASADVIYDAATAPPPTIHPEIRHWQRMSIRDLTFRHRASRGDGPSLEGLSFSLERGKRYALIGASGSGKSTLLRLLAGLYPAERVALTVDDGLIHVVPAEAAQILRAGATLIPQDAEVYEGTLEENLNLYQPIGGPPAPTAPADAAASYASALQAACAHDFVEVTPSALRAVIAERGANLSGGQRSRLALARGILAATGSTLVLMDEPTASLDPTTESRVYDNLFATFADACLVSSIHRLNLLGRFDEVLVMRDGRLIAQGPPDELALNCAEFRRLTSLGGQTAHDQVGSAPSSRIDRASAG